MARKKQPRHLPAALLGVGVLLGVAAMVWDRVDDPGPIVVEGGSAPALRIAWAGDTFLGDGATDAIRLRGIDWPLAGVRHVLADADVSVANAEAPITEVDDPFLPAKQYSYRSEPTAALAMAQAGIDVLGLANNHAMDQGPPGLADTVRHADRAGLRTFGAGRNRRAAERPLLIRSSAVTVGVVGLGEGYGSSVTAAQDRAGTIPMSSTSIRRGAVLARNAGADIVVAYIHWGENYEGIVDDQRRQAARFASAGYDLVIGHGPHVSHPVEVVDGMPVFHSLGNFVFGAPGRFTDAAPGFGYVLETVFTEQRLASLRLTCLVVDNDVVDYQPRVCDPSEAQQAFATLGVAADIRGAVADLRLPVG